MSYLLNKKDDILIHLIFIFILSLFYLIPYFLVGHLIVTPHDILDTSVVENYIIGRIYGGDTESINLFLAGEIKWYYLTRILQPLSLLYALFETEFAYWLTDILIKLICYLCFFKLSRKLNCSVFNSALIACLIVSSVSPYYSILGLGMATFPYLIYLVIKNKNLNLKHYFIIAFIGLNFALVFHVFIVPILLLVSLIFCSNYQQYNLKLFIKISVVLLFFAFLSNSNLIYAQLFSGPFHRTGYIFEAPDLIVNFTELVREFFSIPVIKGNPYFYQRFLFDLCAFFIIIISLFSKNKKVYFLLLIIFFIAFFNFLLNLESIAVLRNNVGGIFKTISWDFIKFSLPVLYGLLFVLNIKFVTEKIKHFFYPLIFLILIISQVNVSIVPLTKHFLSFNTLNLEQKNQLRESFHGHKYTQLISDIIEFNRNNKKEFKVDFKSQYTFRGYYDYENYRYIKSLVGDSRTVSIALDPMVAVMNNIKVIDGYHTLYPLSYKLKFRKVIEKQLDNSEETKKYFDLWGNRISTFVEDKESIKTNFIQAKLLGAEYVISKYSISNDNLLPICEKCNNSAELFLYKIII